MWHLFLRLERSCRAWQMPKVKQRLHLNLFTVFSKDVNFLSGFQVFLKALYLEAK